MPLEFDIVSRLMVVGAIAMVALPLIRRAPGGRTWPSVAVAALFIYLGSAVAYDRLSNWHWPTASTSGNAPVSASNKAEIDQLRAAAAAAPDSPAGWSELAVALLREQRPADAVAPLQKVYELTNGASADQTIMLVDALIMSDTTAAARGRVSTLVEEVLDRAPDHPKALFYGAELALARNDLPLSRERMTRLLARAQDDPSAEAQQVRDALVRRIALIDERLGGGQAVAAAQPTSAPAGATGPSLTVDVTLDPVHMERLAPDAPVFVLARDGAGPPIAVVRRKVADLPFSVTLSDANAMLPSRRLSGFESVEVVARVSPGGSPIAKSGDISGRARVATSRSEPVAIVMRDVEP